MNGDGCARSHTNYNGIKTTQILQYMRMPKSKACVIFVHSGRFEL